jgi:hypothetical protein
MTIQLLGLEILVSFTVELQWFHCIMLVKSQSAQFLYLISITITGIFAQMGHRIHKNTESCLFIFRIQIQDMKTLSASHFLDT